MLGGKSNRYSSKIFEKIQNSMKRKKSYPRQHHFQTMATRQAWQGRREGEETVAAGKSPKITHGAETKLAIDQLSAC